MTWSSPAEATSAITLVTTEAELSATVGSAREDVTEAEADAEVGVAGAAACTVR